MCTNNAKKFVSIQKLSKSNIFSPIPLVLFLSVCKNCNLNGLKEDEERKKMKHYIIH